MHVSFNLNTVLMFVFRKIEFGLAWHGTALHDRTTVWYLGQVKWCACIVVIATNKSLAKFPVKNKLEMQRNNNSIIYYKHSFELCFCPSHFTYSYIENHIKYLLNAITGLYCTMAVVVFFIKIMHRFAIDANIFDE